MTKHKDKREIQADATTINQARAAVAEADAAYVAAISEAQRIADTWPGGAMDRRLLNESLVYPAHDRSDPQLSKEQRRLIDARIAYEDATKAEGRAYGALERARRILDELERAARLAALGDGRQALRDAIAVHAEAERAHRVNEDAVARANDDILNSYGKEADAEGALSRVKAEAPARAAAEYRGEVVEPGQTVEQAEAELRSILERRQTVKDAKAALQSESGSLSSTVRFRADDVTKAVAHVVKASPATWALVDAYRQAKRRHEALQAALNVLSNANALPDGFRLHERSEVDQSMSLAWSDALAALRFDADMKLPEVA